MIHTLHSKETSIYAATPDVGKGNIAELKIICNELREAGFLMTEDYPKGMWVRAAAEFHIRMSQSTDATIKYSKASNKARNSIPAKRLFNELKNVLISSLKNNPDAQFFISPQNMMGEIATEVEYNGKKFFVIMVLPDSMGKLSPLQEPTQAQHDIDYLVWNRHSYKVMTSDLRLKYVQLVHPLDPMTGYKNLSQQELKKKGFQEVFDYQKLCVIKLSGSDGDPRLINAAITSLWRNSKVRSMVFAGQNRTKRKILKRIDKSSPKIKQSLDEGEFYNVSRNMQPDSQMMLTYPSEQFKHLIILSKEQRRLKVVWLPPRGEHEINNLIEYILIARAQNEITTVCIPKKHQAYLKKKLENPKLIKTLGVQYKMGKDFKFVEPDQIRKEDFDSVPSWDQHEAQHAGSLQRISVGKAVQNVVAKHQ